MTANCLSCELRPDRQPGRAGPVGSYTWLNVVNGNASVSTSYKHPSGTGQTSVTVTCSSQYQVSNNGANWYQVETFTDKSLQAALLRSPSISARRPRHRADRSASPRRMRRRDRKGPGAGRRFSTHCGPCQRRGPSSDHHELDERDRRHARIRKREGPERHHAGRESAVDDRERGKLGQRRPVAQSHRRPGRFLFVDERRECQSIGRHSANTIIRRDQARPA